MIHRGANVGPDRVSGQRIEILAQVGLQQPRDGGPHPVHDCPEVPGVIVRRLAQVFDGRRNGPALGVTKHHHKTRTVARSRKLHAADLRGSDDVAGHADDEQIPQTLIEYDLRGNARIGASQDDRKRFLAVGQRCSPSLRQKGCRAALIRREPEIPLSESIERFVCWDHRCSLTVFSFATAPRIHVPCRGDGGAARLRRPAPDGEQPSAQIAPHARGSRRNIIERRTALDVPKLDGREMASATWRRETEAPRYPIVGKCRAVFGAVLKNQDD